MTLPALTPSKHDPRQPGTLRPRLRSYSMPHRPHPRPRRATLLAGLWSGLAAVSLALPGCGWTARDAFHHDRALSYHASPGDRSRLLADPTLARAVPLAARPMPELAAVPIR